MNTFRGHWISPLLLASLTALGFGMTGCGDGTVEYIKGDATIVEDVGSHQHGHLEYIDGQQALVARMNMQNIVEFTPDTAFTGVLLNIAAESMPRMEYAYYRLDGSLSPFQELSLNLPEATHTDASIALTEMSTKLLIKFGEGAETVTFVRAEFVDTANPEGDLDLDDDWDESREGELDSQTIRLEARRDGRYIPRPSVVAAGKRQQARYDDAPAWNRNNCGGSFRPGAKQLAEYLKKTFPGAKSYGGYSCRQNTANTSKMSVHGTGRAIDLFVPLDRGQADNDLGDPIADWLIENASILGVQYIVWDRTSWNPGRSGDKHRAYTGPHPHHDHLHIEVNNEGAAGRLSWYSSPGSGTTPGTGSGGGGTTGGGSGASCDSRTLGRSVPHGEAVQMAYASCGGGACNWATCDNGSWSCTPSSALGSATTHAHNQCSGVNQPSSGGSSGGNTTPTGSSCHSRTLGRDVPAGSCVQMNYNSCGGSGTCKYAECDDGAWTCIAESACSGQKFAHSDCAPPPVASGKQCFSKTLGRNVPSGECVQMPYEACSSGTCSWATCDDGAWTCSDVSSCGGATHGHSSCGRGTGGTSGGGTSGGGTSGGGTGGGGTPGAAPGTTGQPAGTFWITYYYKAEEDKFSGPKNTGLFDANCNKIADVSKAYSDSICIEGSGKLSDGRVLNYAKKCNCGSPCPTGGTICYSSLDTNKFPYGIGNRNNALVPLRSLAVDTRVVANNTLIYLKEFDGLDIPKVGDIGGFKHDGCFRADDVGGAIKNDHFDVFAGTSAMHTELEKLLATRTRVNTWTRADQHCAHLKN